MNPIIKTEGLNLYYDKGKPAETQALKDINIEIFAQEYVAFFGPSGCGKSTLLYCIAGIETPTSGKVIINGKDISKFNNFEMSEFHRQQIGMVFQAYNLIPTLNVADNVALPQVFAGEGKRERLKKAMELLDRFGIAPQANKLTQEMSGGQQQRVGIARSLINNPPILLADEPIGNLDTKSAQIVLDILYQLNEKDKRTIILVTHDPRNLTYAHRVFYMQDGKIIRTVDQRQSVEKLTPEAKKIPQLTATNPIQEIRTKQESAQKINTQLLCAYLSENYSLPDKLAFQNLFLSYISQEMNWVDFIDKLGRPKSQNGLGLSQFQISLLAKEIEDLFFEINLLKNRTENELKYMPLTMEIAELRRSLLRFFDGTMSILQIRRLEQAIEDYIRRSINRDIFEKVLTLPLTKGGIGVNLRIARRFGQKMEAIISK